MMTNVIEIESGDCGSICVYDGTRECYSKPCTPELHPEGKSVIYVYASVPAVITYPRDSEGTY